VKRGLVAAFLVALAVCATACGADTPKITESELVQRTQELFDAVAPGNQAPWKMYVAEDAMFFDEKGRAMDKRALLEDLQPLPAGYSGSIRVMRAKHRDETAAGPQPVHERTDRETPAEAGKASGHVDMMIDRRNNEDLLWKKIR
jgi:hypothetical protein